MMLRYPTIGLRWGSFSSKRTFLTKAPIRISDEIKQAISERKPVVSLESTIITHGMPFPANLEMAKQVEEEIRNSGAIPATIAIVKGVPCVGLQNDELEYLANSKNVNKVSRRDLAYTASHGLNGGTTISGTMILSEIAGIKVFATGGLGGVHRDGHITMDVSADLDELGRTPVAVVCAGPKSILDIERTMEYLETKGCFVGTYGPSGTNIPGFFCRDSKVSSPYNFQSFKEAASIIHHGNMMNLRSGYLFCVPAPKEISMDSDFIESVINEANKNALELGIKGKEITPFLLKNIAAATGGSSVSSNIGFVLNNAKAGAEIAKELSILESQSYSTFQPSTKLNKDNHSKLQKKESLKQKTSQHAYQPNTIHDAVVIGSVAMDLNCSLTSINMGDSNPGKISSSIGGVGYNIALAAKYSGQKENTSVKFISSVGKDMVGSQVISILDELSVLNSSALYVDSTASTAEYVSFHGTSGELVVACADMSIIENIPPSHIERELRAAKPKWCAFDANLSTESMSLIMRVASELNIRLLYEPTSSAKAPKISGAKNLGVYPKHAVQVITPSANELITIYDSFKTQELFDLDKWFPVMDSLGLDSIFRQKLDAAALRSQQLSDALRKGIPQQAFQLLPFFPNILVKDGKNGVFFIGLSRNIGSTSVNKSPTELSAALTISSKGKIFDGYEMGVVVEHYPALQELEIVNVTGAGDSLVGAVLQHLSQNDVSDLSENNFQKSLMINRAQLAASLSLQCKSAVSDAIRNI